jgi:hypothetical protein
MATVSLQKASEILKLAPGSVERLRRDGVLFAWNGKYDETSVYMYQLTQDYARKNGKEALIDHNKRKRKK